MSGIPELLRRLQEHSGLPIPGANIRKDTLAEFLFTVTRNGSTLKLPAITSDIVWCLDQLNRQMNQSSSREAKWHDISKTLTYSVSGIVGRCLETIIELQNRDVRSEMARNLLHAVWQIECAWDAVLSGDIDDVVKHVALESEARSFIP